MPTRIVLGLVLMGGMGLAAAPIGHAAVPPPHPTVPPPHIMAPPPHITAPPPHAAVPQTHLAAPSFHPAGLAGPAVIGGPAKWLSGVVLGKPIRKPR